MRIEHGTKRLHDVGAEREMSTRWDLESIYASEDAWRGELKGLVERASLCAQQGASIFSAPETLYESLVEIDQIHERLAVASTYADLLFYSNTQDPVCAARRDEVAGISSKIDEVLAFIEPALLGLPEGTLQRFQSMHAELSKTYGRYLAELERSRPHVLSAEQEELMGKLSVVCSGPERIREALHDGDMAFSSSMVGDPPITHGVIDELLQSNDREVRRSAFERYWKEYSKYPQTFGSILSQQGTVSAAFAKARNHPSVFDEVMFGDNLPASLYTTVINVCREHYPLFRRYFNAKAELLGIDSFCEYDIFAKLSQNSPAIDYAQGVEIVFESLQPLGEEYVKVARKGVCEDSWVDVYPREGKYSNAFSAGTLGTKPYFLLNYAPTMAELGTFAHELGHSMHSYKTNRSQPFVNTHYAMSVAETASNLNQVLLREHVLKNCDQETAFAVLDEAFYFAHRYLYLMPTLSRVENIVHSMAARGRSVNADEMKAYTVAAFRSAYGDSVHIDPDLTGMKWASFCHFYMPYYMFQYAIGISAAMSIGQRILSGEPGIVEKYHEFLSSGSSRSVLDTFKLVDLDITSMDMYRQAMKVVEGYVLRLEQLVELRKK
jgi:oligoendopeptidase F